MALRKLPTHFGSMMQIAALFLSLLLMGLLQGCVLGNERIGTTLEFLNHSRDYIVVERFDPDGLRGPVPGALGVGGRNELHARRQQAGHSSVCGSGMGRIYPTSSSSFRSIAEIRRFSF
jgi:hypothetical protein